MKNLIILITSIIIGLSGINSVEAGNLEKKLYKSVIISKHKIEKEYKNGATINKKIANLFLEYRYKKNKVALNKLETLLRGKIIAINTKNNLTRKDRLNLNLYNNLFYRTTLLLNYQLK